MVPTVSEARQPGGQGCRKELAQESHNTPGTEQPWKDDAPSHGPHTGNDAQSRALPARGSVHRLEQMLIYTSALCLPTAGACLKCLGSFVLTRGEAGPL